MSTAIIESKRQDHQFISKKLGKIKDFRKIKTDCGKLIS